MFAYLRSLYPEFYPWWEKGSIRGGLLNLLKSLSLTCSGILDLLSVHGVVLIVTSMIGAPAAALFTTLRTMANTTTQAAGLLLNPLQPDIVRYHLEKNGKMLMAIGSTYWITTGIALNGGAIMGLFIVEKLFHFWTRGNLQFDRALYGWVAAAALLRVWSAPLNAYLLAINQVHGLLVMTAVRGAMVAVGGVAMAMTYGLGGIGVALFLSELVGSAALCGVLVARTLKRNGIRASHKEPLMAGISVGLGASSLILFGYSNSWGEWAMIAMGGICIVGYVQWLLLPIEIQSRTRELIFRPTAVFKRTTPA
jgi:O-antigen/teichoic acid export membrane protein